MSKHKLIQLSTTWCPHCKLPEKISRTILEADEYIITMLDDNTIGYDGEGDMDDVVKGVEKVLKDGGRPRGVPSFRVVDGEYNIVSSPSDYKQGIELVQELNK